MSNNKIVYLQDSCRSNDIINLSPGRFNSKIEIYNDSGELVFGPLHNKTVIAGAGLTLMKLFNLDRSCLDNTPTYDEIMELDEAASTASYPSINVVDNNGTIVGSMADEMQRKIIGFCVGIGGAGLEASDVFEVPYASWIEPDNLVPFRYPLVSADTVDESIYKGKKTIELSNGQTRAAYYFKEFTNTPSLVQNYVSTIGTFTDSVSKDNVYSTTTSADRAQSYVELHLKITQDDCREFFVTHTGLEDARINQISLLSGWTKTVSKTKLDVAGNVTTKDYEVYQDVRPFSICSFPSEALLLSKSINIIYSLYA